MDEQKLNELIYEIREMVRAFSKLGQIGAQPQSAADPSKRSAAAFDRSSERLVRALGQLAATMRSSADSQEARTQGIRDFVAAVDRATDAAEADAVAAEARAEADAAAAAAAEELSRVQQELAQRSTWTAQQREAHEREILENEKRSQAEAKKIRIDSEQDRAREALHTFGRERNYAQELAEAKLHELVTIRSVHQRLGDFGNIVAQVTGRDLVKTQMVIMALAGAVGTAVGAMTSLGKSVLSLGREVSGGFTSFTQFNGIVDTVANSISKMGQSIPFFGAAMVAAAEGSKFLLNQLQTTAQAFNDIAQVGGLTARGMDEIYERYLESGMTLDAFKKNVMANSTALARLGGTVGEGTRGFTKLTNSLIDSDIGLELRRLGLNSEQIGETAAAFVSQQTRLGRAQRMGQDELKNSTVKYIKELDVISRLTGIQRNELQKRMDAALNEQRFRAKTDELSRKGQGDLARDLNLLSAVIQEQAPDIAEGFRDIVAANGAVTTPAAQRAMVATQGRISAIAQAALRGEDVGQVFQQLTQAAGGGVKTFNSLARYADLSDTVGNYAQLSNLANVGLQDQAEALRRARLEQDQSTNASTKLTEATVTAQKEMEEVSRNINTFGMLAMPMASEAVAAFSSTLNKGIKEISEILGVELPTVGQQQAGAGPVGKKTDPGVISEVGQVLKDTGNMKYGAAAKGVSNLGGRAMNAVGRGLAAGLEALGAEKVAGSMRGVLAKEEQMRLGTTGQIPAPQGSPAAEVPGNQPTSGLPPGKQLTDVLNFTSPSGTQQAFDGLNQQLRQRVIQAAVEYNKLTGQKLTINSALRSRQDQERLYQESIDAGHEGLTAPKPRGMPIARPGHSPHEQGLAVDIQQYQDPRALAALNRAGLYNRVSGDPVHFHMADGGVLRAQKGGTLVRAAEAGKNEAFVPLPNGRSIPVDLQDSIEHIRKTLISSRDLRPRGADMGRDVRDFGAQVRQISQSFERGINVGDLSTSVRDIGTSADRMRSASLDISQVLDRAMADNRAMMQRVSTTAQRRSETDAVKDIDAGSMIDRIMSRSNISSGTDMSPMFEDFRRMSQDIRLLTTDGVRLDRPEPRITVEVPRDSRTPDLQSITDRMQSMIRETMRDTRVDFQEISRRNQGPAAAYIDTVRDTMLPEIREVLREIRETTQTEAAAARAEPQSSAVNADLARQIGRELGTVIENALRQQGSADAMTAQLMERLVDLQSRNTTATERLLRVSTS